MKALILISTLLSSTSVFATEINGEAVHCEKSVFLSDARSILDLTLVDDKGQIFFGKLKSENDQVESYNPVSIAVKKSYQDPRKIEIIDQNDGTIESGRLKLVLKFKKLINAEEIEYTGDIESPKKNLNNMTCTVRPVVISVHE